MPLEVSGFDTYTFVQALKTKGMDEDLAAVIAEGMNRRNDVSEIKAEIQSLRSELKRDLQSLDHRFTEELKDTREEITVIREVIRDLQVQSTNQLNHQYRWFIGLLLAQIATLATVALPALAALIAN